MNGKFFSAMKKRGAAALAMSMLVAAGRTGTVHATGATATPVAESRTIENESKFTCNTKALNPAERARHKQMTEKLIAARNEIVETEKGYEFQYDPSRVSIAELAEWVVAEGKCCPFLDFHIDLEREGSLACLRLTGQEGIKAFIRTEFQVPGK
jgi:hypothetical protein